MHKETFNRLFKELDSNTIRYVANKYNINESTLSKWKKAGRYNTEKKLFKTCKMCCKGFFSRQPKSIYCSDKCALEGKRERNKRYYNNSSKQYTYEDKIKRKFRYIKQRILDDYSRL